MGIGKAQWPRPDEGDHPSIEARRGIETGKATIACSVLKGEGDKEGNDFCANLEDRDKEAEVLRWRSTDDQERR
jgi:hypothetical protein